MDLTGHRYNIAHSGFTVVEDIYTGVEVNAIINAIESADRSGPLFRQTGDVFAIRQLLKAIPDVPPLLFNDNLKSLISNIFGEGYFVVKSIYFDKPGSSNWFVAWHQDLTISVDNKVDIRGYGPWTDRKSVV